MPNDQLANGVDVLVSSELQAASDDGYLLTLEAQLDDLIAELLAAQKATGEPVKILDQVPPVPDSSDAVAETASATEARTTQIEAILARLYPIERAIMAAPAYTIIGLGVKARHAAYVMSQYWEEPTEKIDWEAQTIRLLIEAVCDVARMPLSFLTRGR